MHGAYNHIWSKTLNRLIVVPECVKGSHRKSGRWKAGAALFAVTGFCAPALAQSVLPTGGQVVSGAATISTSGNAMTINQSSDRMIANWQSFSIGANNSVTFNQPGASSVALNRVIGQDPSQILGSLKANGQVFLVNPNGVMFGKGAQVQTGAFVASTLGISNQDFLTGNYRFSGTGGAILNQGDLSGKVVALIAPSVTNEGTIKSRKGGAALAAGTDVLLDFDGDGLLSVEVKASTVQTLVDNKGLIKADGGTAILTAKGASDALKGVVNNSGTVQARTIASRGGRIFLLGDMANGEVKVSGKLDASAPKKGNGGFIETSAKKVTIAESAQITTKAANGKTGTWLIDPNDFTIAASGGDITGSVLSSQLASNNVTIQSANGGTAGNGDIFVNGTVTWSANTLTLHADRNITVNTAMNGSGTAGLALEYGQGAVAAGNTATYTINAPVNLAATGSFSTKLGSDGSTVNYTIITSLGAAGSTTGTDLQGINGGLSGNYVLGANIDATLTTSWNFGAGFAPIGNSGTAFNGVFDGLGHAITTLIIDRPSSQYVGLFGYVGSTGLVRNLALSAGSVRGMSYVGALAGQNDGTIFNTSASNIVSGPSLSSILGGLVGGNAGTISHSHTTAPVSGDAYLGGLVGYNDVTGVLADVYATGTVTARNGSMTGAGGLVGENHGSVTRASAIGAVKGDASGALSGLVGGLVGGNYGALTDVYALGSVKGGTAGGLVGLHASGSISRAYATGSISGGDHAAGLAGDNSGTISEAYATGAVSGGSFSGGLVAVNAGTVSAAAWNKDSTGQSIGYGQNTGTFSGSGLTNTQLTSALPSGFNASAWGNASNNTSPYLLSYLGPVQFRGDNSQVYQPVLTLDQLQAINNRLDLNYALVGNLDASATSGWNSGAGFAPIGNGSTPFTGIFDGMGHTIGDLTINRPSTDSVGLFGTVGSGGVVRNLGLGGGSTTGRNAVGPLAGASYGMVSNTFATGTVNGQVAVGGLVGSNGGTITLSYATGAVSGFQSVGGLVGSNRGTVQSSYAGSAVNGSSEVGGLAGYNGGSISASWASATVTGSLNTGGLVGQNDSLGTVLNAYATGNVSGGDNTGGLVGSNTGTITSAYATGVVSGNGGSTAALVGTNFFEDSFPDPDTGDPIPFLVDGTVNASVWNTSTSGQASACVGGICNATGLTTAQMKDPFRFIDAGWNFTSVWGKSQSGNNSGYMVLKSLDNTAYDDYVRLSNNTTRAYGDSSPPLSGIALDGAGTANVSLAWGSAITATTNVGTYAYASPNVITVNDTAGRSAYVDYGSGALAITPRVISLTGNRTYDGTTNVAASAITLGNLANGETLTLTGVGQLADKNAGNGKSFSLGTLALGGVTGLASNYTLVGGTDVANIAKATISSVGITASNKTYDTTTAATLDTANAVFNGMVAGDALTVTTATGAFADKNAGTGKTVNITGLSLGGASAGNYTLASTSATTMADIAKAALMISGFSTQNKTYDGTATASIVSAGMLNGVIGGDTVSFANTGATFTDKNAGTGKTVTLNGALAGTDAGNYTLVSGTTMADIAKAAIAKITGITAKDKPYDGNTTATLNTAGASFTGKAVGDSLSVATGTGAFTDPNPGTNKMVNITGLSLGGIDAQNYMLLDTTATATASINAVIPPPLAPQQITNGNTGNTGAGAVAVPTSDIISGGPNLIDTSALSRGSRSSSSSSRSARNDNDITGSIGCNSASGQSGTQCGSPAAATPVR